MIDTLQRPGRWLALFVILNSSLSLAAPAAGKHEVLVRRFYAEAWNLGKMEVVDELFAAECVRHDPSGRNEPGPQPELQKKIAAGFRQAFPDVKMVVDITAGSDEVIAARWTATGTDTGGFMGAKPTGKAVKFSGVNLYRFANDKVVELWNHRDDLSLMIQLGVVTMPAPPPKK